MSQTLTLSAEDGHQLAAYRAAPAGAPRGGLVVVQEIFGVNAHIKKVADRWAADGYVALAPALFDRVERGVDMGYEPNDIQQGRELRGKISTDDSVRDLRAAVRELARAGLRVGVVGYCWGGTMAWLAATRIDGLSAAVGYYGGGIADTAEESPRCPVMLHFGETDTGIPKEHYEKVQRIHPTLPVHVYPAGHGFSCDARASYHEPSARQARERTLDFFRQHVG
jgi:carboxymethylenebutenolidase